VAVTGAFYHRDGERFVPTVHTRGPWSEGHQHGGPPSALLTRALEAEVTTHALARLSVQLRRPVPLQPLTVTVARPEGGRTVRHATAELRCEGELLATASGLFIRRRATDDAPEPPAFPGPPPGAGAPFTFPFFPWEEGYHQAIELRLPEGERWGGPELRLWARPRVDLVRGEPDTPAQRVAVLVDAQSGFAPPVEVQRFTYVNPELVLGLARPAHGSWVGLHARSTAGDQGVALTESTLFDERGRFGHSAQVMVLSSRRQP